MMGAKPFTPRACGSRMKLRRYGFVDQRGRAVAHRSRSCRTGPSRSGPTRGLPSIVWQATQPLASASARPCATARVGAAGRRRPARAGAPARIAAKVGCACCHAWKLAASSTTTMAAHVGVADAAQLGAQRFVAAGLGRREPEGADLPGHDVHAGAKRRHEEVVQHVVRTQQHLHRLVQRQVHLARDDEQVVLRGRIRRIEPEGVAGADEARVAASQLAVRAGQAEAPLPLLAQHLEHQGVARRLDVVCVHDQARAPAAP